MSLNFPFKKESIDFVLETLAKKCKEKRLTGPINIYIVGGASLVLTFDYRKTTIDIDAYYESSEELSNAFSEVAKELELPSDWINKEFAKTPSYSEKIFNVAKIYSIYEEIIYTHRRYAVCQQRCLCTVEVDQSGHQWQYGGRAVG